MIGTIFCRNQKERICAQVSPGNERWFDLHKNSAPGTLPALGQVWSRGIGELVRESMALGYDKIVNSKDHPALTGQSRQRITYRYERFPDSHPFHYEFKQPVACFSIRLGPVPRGRELVRASRDGDHAVPCEVVDSGDSRWVWLRNQQGQSGTVAVNWR
jgi:hypothetical protein